MNGERSGTMERLLRAMLPAVVLGLGILAWDLTVRINQIPHYVLPSPGLVLTTLVTDWPVLSASLQLASPGRPTPDLRADSRGEFLDGEGLGEKVVGAGFEPLHAMAALVAPRHEYHRRQPRASACLQFSTQLQTRHSRHHHIDQHEIWRVLGDEAQCVSAVVGNTYAVPGDGQKVAHAVGVRRVIIDNYQLAERFHLVVSLLT